MDDVLNSGDPEEWLSDTKKNRFETFRDTEVVGQHCEGCQYDPGPVIKRGTLDAELLVIGSFPEPDDFKNGKPFSGAAGNLLREMLEAIGLDWERDCYLTSALLCGGPEDHPRSRSVEACRLNVNRQIELVSPDLVLGLGSYANCSLYHEPLGHNFKETLGPRGALPDFPWLESVVTVHPGTILQKSDEDRRTLKRLVWKHLQQVKELLQREPETTEPESSEEND